MYITSVLPTGNKSLGLEDLDTNSTVPELSDTVGSGQDTRVPPNPKSISKSKLVGQATWGGTKSTAKVNKFNN